MLGGWEARGQGESAAPVGNALVTLIPQNAPALSSILADGGAPSGVMSRVAEAGQLLSVQVPSEPTNSTGYFGIDTPGGTNYNLTVSAPGYVQAIANTLPISNNTGSGPKNLTIIVQPSAVLSGVVTDGSDNPISGIIVSVGSGPNSANYDVTMDNGVFVLDSGLKTGNYTVHAFRPSENFYNISGLFTKSGIVVPQIGRLPVPLPDAGYQVFSANVSLEEGKLTNLKIKLVESEEISGTVYNQTSHHPISGILVMVFDSSGNLIDAVSTDNQGHYSFRNGLGPERYSVVIPSVPTTPYGPQGRTVTASARNVDFFLNDPGTITGRVVDSAGRGVQGATVIGSPVEGYGTNITALLPKFLATSTNPVITGDDGSFTLRGGGQTGGPWFAVHAYFGDALPVSGSGIVVPGTNAAQIFLDFSESIIIKGTIQDDYGKPLAGARILPSFATSIPASVKFAAISGADGSFTMTVPLKKSDAKTLFDSIIVYANGFNTHISPVSAGGQTIVKMTRSSNHIEGRVVTQGSGGIPSVETAVVKRGTLLVQEGGNATFPIQASTNSKVIGASYNFTSRQLALHLEGVEGSQGKSEFAFPADLMAGPYSIMVDGHTLNPDAATVLQNRTTVDISFTHDHGAREVVIQGASIAPEFPTPVILASAGIGTAIIALRLIRMRCRLFSNRLRS